MKTKNHPWGYVKNKQKIYGMHSEKQILEFADYLDRRVDQLEKDKQDEFSVIFKQ